jgi:hypothetical protein
MCWFGVIADHFQSGRQDRQLSAAFFGCGFSISLAMPFLESSGLPWHPLVGDLRANWHR